MSVLCTGSIAIDQIMVFHDRFENHILPDKIHSINVSFYVPKLEKRWGGTGANVAYNLRILGVDPILLGTVGSDFGAYAGWMDKHGVRRDWIRVFDDVYTAQAFITTDEAHNQINSFHPGAMDRAHEAGLGVGDPREIELGLDTADGWLEVRSGLEEGELIVVSSQFLIDSESNLQEARKKFLAAETAPETLSEMGAAKPMEEE